MIFTAPLPAWKADVDLDVEESVARVRGAPNNLELRNVRPRLDTLSEPEQERISVSSQAASGRMSWPNISDIARII